MPKHGNKVFPGNNINRIEVAAVNESLDSDGQTTFDSCGDNRREISALKETITKLTLDYEKIRQEQIKNDNYNSSKTANDWSQVLEEILESYQSSFTVHGLSFIVKGRPIERVSWAIFTLAVLILAGYMTNSYLARYFKKDIRTEIRYVDLPVTHLPAIKVFFKYGNGHNCHKGMIFNIKSDSLRSCVKPVEFKVGTPNGPSQSYQEHVTVNANETYVDKGRGKKFTITIPHVDDAHVDDPISLVFQSAEELRHQKMSTFITQYSSSIDLYKGEYDITVEKETIERLPAPYPSKCSSKKNLFSDVYTVASCEEECLFNKLYQTCGDVPDAWKTHLHSPAQPYQGHEFLNQAACIWHLMDMYGNGELSLGCQCPSACKVVSYKKYIKPNKMAEVRGWNILLSYSPSRIETRIKEVPDFTLEEFLGAFGGIVGLCVGASLLSVIELLVYTTLYIVKKMVIRDDGMTQMII